MPKDHLVRKGRRVPKVMMDRWDRLDQLVAPVRWAQKAYQGESDRKVQLAYQGESDQKVQPARQVQKDV